MTINELRALCKEGKKKLTDACVPDGEQSIAINLNALIEAIAEQKPVKPDIEGGGSSWFYVCGECHGSVNPYDKHCRHCGREIDWSDERTGQTP